MNLSFSQLISSKYTCFRNFFFHFLRILLFQVSSFWIELTYFIIFSTLGFLALKASTPRKDASFIPKDFDLFFTSVSSVTVSSMSTVEMEVFSNGQLIIMTFLMFLGGEVFTSLLGLQLNKFKTNKDPKIANSQSDDNLDQIELGVSNLFDLHENDQKSFEVHHHLQHQDQDDLIMMNNPSFTSILASVVLIYLLLVHFLGSTFIYMYYEIIPSAKKVLREKGLNLATFSVFTTVSTFANCGFIPTNENMMIFKKNSGLLLIMIPQILLGNTLYPACLRCFMWLLHKITKRDELKSILSNRNSSAILGYDHLFSSLHSTCLAVTVVVFVVVQFVVFGVLEWNNSSEATSGLSAYEKVVGTLFQVVNSRHSGESVFDLSLITPAIIVLFVIMMYLPPHTCFFPFENAKTSSTEPKKTAGRKRNLISYLLFSQLTYLAIFIILICIAERDKLKEDPLNFSLLNIVVEVISAYGNVGFSMGYSCKRQIKASESCRDATYGFAGKWSNTGKLILIIVMFFGRLKKFNLKSHKVWKLQ
ncbi:OLC1v1035899C1 [Oldenlandia corymbosa var. corymbosa]|uniref:OLC1v1035899C1 n=1 Tax=Oldenlandia corymbosa var. corymbosa TaxID=529605 RepID=A0AAV1CV65_OLDCO|nr:OLC1v1035899C1 [Oldenlandia corymbosa var. corymbosa]